MGSKFEIGRFRVNFVFLCRGGKRRLKACISLVSREMQQSGFTTQNKLRLPNNMWIDYTISRAGNGVNYRLHLAHWESGLRVHQTIHEFVMFRLTNYA